MTRHTTFRFSLDPTVEQEYVLDRHAGASRFAYNQCLRFVFDARRGREGGQDVKVPRTGYDLISRFNAWKKSPEAGRVFIVDTDGVAQVGDNGLVWRREVYQQVFEEAAVDLGRGLAAWSESRRGERAGPRISHPRFKKKATARASFRIRNQFPKRGKPAIRVGDGPPRSVRLPRVGTLQIREDTRRLRRMITKGRARILFATVSRGQGRWWVSLNVEAADLHPERRHPARDGASPWMGVDLGLTTLAVVARSDGTEVDRITTWPRVLTRTARQRRKLHRAVTRKKRGSRNRRKSVERLGRYYARTARIRRHHAHEVSNRLVKTHARLAIEHLDVRSMLARNPNLAEAIHDVGWNLITQQVAYKQAWRGGEVAVVDRFFPSSKTCSGCRSVQDMGGVAVRTFVCRTCGLTLDRDLNAAANLAAWAELHHGADVWARDLPAEGPVNNAHRRERSGHRLRDGATDPDDVEPEGRRSSPDRRTPEKGGACRLHGAVSDGSPHAAKRGSLVAPYAAPMPLSAVEPRLDSPDPTAQFAAYLDYYRAAVERKLDGLGETELRTSRLPSGWTPLELLIHLVHMERRWFVWGFLGEQVADPWGDHADGAPDGAWRVPDGVAPDALVAALHAGGERTRTILAEHDLAERGAVGGRFTADPPTLTWICFHVLQEYARHAGHLDIARELADGGTGE
ncbi:RNA-guided endonuclease TnpB family protein [Isoptericola croceus]|uniref:RNA-guided endonuclease TnpB family protein n=1 Tax=Isoptericola croceus TaxID=3031406 RepID=UPI0023F76804|nr:RNA-guided endonuclease TnpB family protein [Isoptericola croceus]